MTFEEFMKKHKADFEEYKAALAAIVEKRAALRDYYWRLGLRIQYPEVRGDMIPQNNIYDMDISEGASTVDQLKKQYIGLKKRLEYPIIFDPEYRAAFSKLLSAVRDDVVTMIGDAREAESKAVDTYRKKKVEYYNMCAEAESALHDLERNLNTALFAGHNEASIERDINLQMIADPVLYSNYLVCSPDVMVDGGLKAIAQLDDKLANENNPDEFQRRYDSAFARSNPSTRTTKGIGEATKELHSLFGF